MRPNMRPTEKTDLKGALRSLTVYLQKSLGVILLALVLAALNAPQGLVLNYTGAHTLRFLPPLVATNADIDAMADQLEKLIEA